MPIGLWITEFGGYMYGTRAADGEIDISASLSTSNSATSNDYQAVLEIAAAGTFASFTFDKRFPVIISAASKTTYYIIFRAGAASITEISIGSIPTYIRFICAYL